MVGTPKNMVLSGAARRIAASSKRSKTTADAPAARVPNKPGAEAVHVEEGQAQDEAVGRAPRPRP